MTVGQRIKQARVRSGKTRAVLGGLVGRSESWVKAIETGRLKPPRLPMLVKIAEVLGITDIATLTGDQAMPVDLFYGNRHAALPAVRAAVTSLHLTDTDQVDVPRLHQRLTEAWKARHSAPNHRTVLGRILPGLIRDCQVAVRVEGSASAYKALADCMNLAQMFAAYQSDGNLLWRIAEKGLGAAQQSGDRAAIGGTIWLLAQAHRDAGQWDTALEIVDECLDLLNPNENVNARGMYGSILFEQAYTYAVAGESGQAWRYWDKADSVIETLPDDYYHLTTSFSRPIMVAHAVTTAVELQQHGTALRYAGRLNPADIPSQPRRGRHLIEVARAHYGRGDHHKALDYIEYALQAAPETVRFNGYARGILSDLAQGDKDVRARAVALSG